MTDLDRIVLGVFSSLVLAIGALTHPRVASCPPLWRQQGVATDTGGPLGPRGSFQCHYFPYTETSSVIIDYPGVIAGRIYCANDQVPVQVSDRTVACRRAR